MYRLIDEELFRVWLDCDLFMECRCISCGVGDGVLVTFFCSGEMVLPPNLLLSVA